MSKPIPPPPPMRTRPTGYSTNRRSLRQSMKARNERLMDPTVRQMDDLPEDRPDMRNHVKAINYGDPAFGKSEREHLAAVTRDNRKSMYVGATNPQINTCRL